MVHARSVVPTSKLKEWLENPDKMIDEADFWVSAGTYDHWRWSLNYPREYEDECTYWGSRIEAQELSGIFSAAKGGVATTSGKLFEEFVNGRRPNIVIFYTNNVGIMGAGLVVQCEFDFLNLFWPDEKKSGNVEFPFRFKMKVLWLEPSVLTDKWRGDEELTELLKDYTRSGLQHIVRQDIIDKLRPMLKIRVREYGKSGVRLSSIAERLSVERLRGVLEKRGLSFESSVLEQVISALKSGKHLLLVGPPGTGKTTLARAIAEACNLKLVEKTASGEWSRVDIIGGPVFVGGEVRWKSGALLEAIAEHLTGNGALLLIDEINRANMDRAFGEFFTIFGGELDEWAVPESLFHEMEAYKEGKLDKQGMLLMEEWEKRHGGPLKVPESFRIIATMNVYDRRYLFTLGYALLRRFAVVEVSNPGEDELRKVLSKRCGNEAVINELLELYQDLKNKNFELGIALLIDSVKLACAMAQSNEVKKAVDIAIKMVVVPQLEGLLPDQLKEIKDALKTRNYRESLNLFNRLYQEAEYGERSA